MEKINDLIDLIGLMNVYVKCNYRHDTKLMRFIGEISTAVKNIKRDNKWISVKEELPKCKEKVLVTHRSGVAIASLYDSESQIWIANGGKPHRLKTVTAWRKLPEPYRKEKHGKINV